MKKTVVIMITLAMLASFSVAAMAEDSPPSLVPGGGLNTAMKALEAAQLETSEGPLEQAHLRNEFAEKRMSGLQVAADNAEAFDEEVVGELLADLAEQEENLGLLIAAIPSGKDFPVDAAGLEDIADGIAERGWRLAEIKDDGNMPEGAQAGAQKALDNMEAAAGRAAWALDRDKAGPPDWAGSENRGNGEDAAGDAAPTDIEAPPVVEDGLSGEAPPEDKRVSLDDVPPGEVPVGDQAHR